MTYQPQEFLEDIRRWLVANNPGITPLQRSILEALPITYRPVPLGANGRAEWYSGKLLGATEHDGSHTYIFGKRMGHNQELLAQTAIHEMAHVIAAGNHFHDETWAQSIRTLGIVDSAKHYELNYDMRDSTLLLPWRDHRLAAYVRSLPQVDWTDTDHAPEP